MSTPAQPSSRAELARAWSSELRLTAYVPISDEEIDDFLRAQLDFLVDALGQSEFSPKPASGVGTRLVTQGFTGEQTLGATVEVLGRGLPAQHELRTVEELPSKVISLLGTLTRGFTTAFRHRVLDQQEDVQRALLRIRAIAERDRQVSEARFRGLFDSAPIGIAISRLDGSITETNRALTEILRYPPAELTGLGVRELFHPDDSTRLSAAYQELVEGQRLRFRAKVKLLAAKGDHAWASVAVSVLRDADGSPTHHVTMVEDSSDVHLLEQRLRHQTLHDLLTGLPNQQYFWIHLEALLERAGPAATVTLCKIDLDGFSIVNDGHGHDAGNLVLQKVAERLERLVSEEQAMVARLGADEFAVLIQDSPSTPDTAALAADISSELSEPVYLGEHGLAVSAGIGMVRCPARGIAAAELVRRADATLHRAKRTGRGQWEPYDPHADAAERAHYTLVSSMPGAWENGQVKLIYQPLVRIDPGAEDAGRVMAVQTLLYWEHPDHGVIGPEDCVKLAEQSGLVLSIGPWMLQEACQQLRCWRDRLGATVPPVRVDLNVHLAKDPDMMAVLLGALDRAGLTPRNVQVGMPVELAIADLGDARENLRTLMDAGVGTVFTRFGQGIGNLATLDGKPVHAVDITAQLVRTARRPDSVLRHALTTLVPLIRRTGIGVVVAGIDTAEQADWWRDIGADSARGAAFGEPCAAEDMVRRLAH